MKDFYYILGISASATETEIKAAYRKLSMKFHPDKNQGDEYFSDRFKDIQEAYEILSDPDGRVKYDGALRVQQNSGNNYYEELRRQESTLRRKYEEELRKKEEELKKKEEQWKQKFQSEEQKLTESQRKQRKEEAEKTLKEINTLKQALKTKQDEVSKYYNLVALAEMEIIKIQESINNLESKILSNQSTASSQKMVSYPTDKGPVEVMQSDDYSPPAPGQRTFLYGAAAPTGKYKFGPMWYVHIENGVVVKTTLF